MTIADLPCGIALSYFEAYNASRRQKGRPVANARSMAEQLACRAVRTSGRIRHARRLRCHLMIECDRTMAGVVAILYQVSAGRLLSIGNHCGYPSITLPVDLLSQPIRTGFAEHVDISQVPKGGMLHQAPFGIALTGRLFEEQFLVAIADKIGGRLPMIKDRGIQKYRPC